MSCRDCGKKFFKLSINLSNYVMSKYVMSKYVMSKNVTSKYVMSKYVMSKYVMSKYVTSITYLDKFVMSIMDAQDMILDDTTRKQLICYGHVDRMDPT